MRALLLMLVFLGVSHSASAQQLKIKGSDGTDIEVNLNPGMLGGADPCNRYPFCNNCTMSVRNACGWCVETGQCVSREEGACGQSPMAIAPTQCSAPQGRPRGPGHGGRPPHGGVVIPPPPGQMAPQGMSPAAFQALLNQLKAEPFEEKKLIPLQSAARGNWFTVEQLGELVDAFTFSAGKIKACEAVKSRIVDRENLFMVYGHFTFEADKTKAQKVLEGG